METGWTYACGKGAGVKYFSRVGQNEYEIEIIDDKVFVDGEVVEVDLSQSGAPELYSLLYNGRSFEILIEAERFNYGVTLRGERFDVQVEDERTRRLNMGRKMVALPEGELAISAPIPGLVVRVLVEAGQAVAEDQPLVLLEAMKMENEIRTVRAGVVKQISCVVGQRVEQNAVLVVLE
jgi:biotin carboxyl carrier protein